MVNREFVESKLHDEAEDAYMQGVEDAKNGIEYNPINCEYPHFEHAYHDGYFDTNK